MKKYEVGHRWDIPEEYDEIGRVGGYGIAVKDNKLHIIGKRIFSISDSPIESAGIIPFTGNNVSIESDLEETFYYNPEKLYYGVIYGEKAGVFVFKKREIAFQLLDLLVDFKVNALIDMHKNKDSN